MDAEGNVVGEGDIERQTETVLEHVKTVVEEAGGGMEDIVKVTVFIRDMRLYDEIHAVRRSYFEEPYPASSMVEVSALIDPRLTHRDRSRRGRKLARAFSAGGTVT